MSSFVSTSLRQLCSSTQRQTGAYRGRQTDRQTHPYVNNANSEGIFCHVHLDTGFGLPVTPWLGWLNNSDFKFFWCHKFLSILCQWLLSLLISIVSTWSFTSHNLRCWPGWLPPQASQCWIKASIQQPYVPTIMLQKPVRHTNADCQSIESTLRFTSCT